MAFLATVLALVFAVPAGATVYDAVFVTSLEFAGLGGAQAQSSSVGLATVHTSATGSSHLTQVTLPSLSLVSDVPVGSAHLPITKLRVDVRKRPDLQGGGVIGNISGGVMSGGGLTPNTIPSTGGVTWCLLVAPFPPCLSQLDLAHGGTQSGLHVGSGVGGLLEVGSGSSVRISVIGAPYTVGTVSAVARTANGDLSVLTGMGIAHGPASQTSSTAQAGGVLQLVSAHRIDIDGPGSHDRNGSISRIAVVLLPEPGRLALFGSGAVAMALLGLRSRGR